MLECAGGLFLYILAQEVRRDNGQIKHCLVMKKDQIGARMLKVHIAPWFSDPDRGDGGIRRVWEAQVKHLWSFDKRDQQ